jgi:hypothetical protein
MLMPAGPQSGSASTNYPRGIETGVNWCSDLLEHMSAKGYEGVVLSADRGAAPSGSQPTAVA